MRRVLLAALPAILFATACSGSGGAATTSTTDVAASLPTAPALAAFDGAWAGDVVEGYTVQIRLERGSDGRLTGVLDALGSGTTDLPLTEITEDGTHLQMTQAEGSEVISLDLSADGEVLTGTIASGGQSLPLVLERQEVPLTLDRPQEPQPPYPYQVREVTFDNERAGITLAGTLTIPYGVGPFPGAVLVSGSGPQNRDEDLLGHKPFLVLADALTRSGIAVLRYDDRGFGESGGLFEGATTFDFADDAAAAVDFLAGVDSVDPAAVGIVGHSEGGVIAPILAAADDDGAAWIVLLAGIGVDGASVLVAQTRRNLEVAGEDPEVIEILVSLNAEMIAVSASDAGDSQAYEELTRIANDWRERLTAAGVPVTPDEVLAKVDVFMDPWMRAFVAFDPTETLRAVDVPVLALLGELDVQVLADQNESPLRAAFRSGATPDWEVRVMPGLNHLFQRAESGAVSEYATISETMAPEVLDLVASWILAHSN